MPRMQDRSIVGRCPIELLTDVGLCVVDRGAELKEAAEGARLPRRHAGLRSWFGFRRQVLEFWRARQDLNPRPLARSRAQIFEYTLLFAVTSVADCMTVQHPCITHKSPARI